MEDVALSLALGTLCLLVMMLLVYRLSARRFQQRLCEDASTQARRFERESIVRDMHDTFLQSLHVLSWNLQHLSEQLPTACPVRRAMTAALDLTDTLVADGRDRLQLLSSGVCGRGFLDILCDRGRVFAAGSDTGFSVVCDGRPFDLPPSANAEVTRIAGEAIFNAFRHAGAAQIALHVRYDADELHVAVCDDGCGMALCRVGAVSAGHFGIGIMSQRAKEAGFELRFSLVEGGGTRVDLRVPATDGRSRRVPVRSSFSSSLGASTSHRTAP